MASGVYGKADLAATTWTEIAAAPTSGVKVTSVSICNRGAGEVTIRLAIAADVSSVDDSSYIEYDVKVPGNGVLERSGIVLSATNGLMAYASGTGISAVAYGVDG
jgi:hypothetical protein